MRESWSYRPALIALIGVFLKLEPQTWMNSPTLWHLTSVFVKTCVPTKTFAAYNNNKLRQLRQAMEEAYRRGDRILYNQARNTLTKVDHKHPSHQETLHHRITGLQACFPDICGHANFLRDWCQPTRRTSQAPFFTPCSFPTVAKNKCGPGQVSCNDLSCFQSFSHSQYNM